MNLNWQGVNTFHPDCSSPKGSPWGFKNFEEGTVGIAILDFLINTWDDMVVEKGLSLEDALFMEFNDFINNTDISLYLRDAWMEDNRYLPKQGLIAYETILKDWLRSKMSKYIS